MSLRSFYASVYDSNFPSFFVSLFSWGCLAASTSYFVHVAINLRPPSVTVSTRTFAPNAVAFQSPAKPDARASLYTQSNHSFSFPPCPLWAPPSRFSNMIRFGNSPPLIRINVLAHKILLVCKVISVLSHWVILRARLYEVFRWSGLLLCAPMMRSKPW